MSTPYRYNQKSDMWAMGCVLYEMLTLRKVFDATVSKMSLKFHVHMVSDPSPLQGGGWYSTRINMAPPMSPTPYPFVCHFEKVSLLDMS